MPPLNYTANNKNKATKNNKTQKVSNQKRPEAPKILANNNEQKHQHWLQIKYEIL